MPAKRADKAQLDSDQIDLIISTIETVCKMLLALIGILKGLKR